MSGLEWDSELDRAREDIRTNPKRLKPAIEANENLDAGDSIREGVEHLLAKCRDYQQHLS